MKRSVNASFVISFIAIAVSCSKCNVVAQSKHDYLSLGHRFTGNQSIQSQNGKFELGLFYPRGTNACYLGIWFLGISPQTVIWVANRNRPGFRDASFLLSSHGELLVLASDESVLWSSGTKGMRISSAVLKDVGNLVLQSEDSSVIWESFRHPADVFLPTMKMVVGTKLISWKSPSDPAEGPYSIQLLEKREFVLTWKGTRQYWNSGVWNGENFANIPEQSKDSPFNISFDRNSSFTWFVSSNYSSSNVSKFVVNSNGQLQLSTWLPKLNGWTSFWAQPADPCYVYGVCADFGMCNSTSSDVCRCPVGFEAANPKAWSLHEYSTGCKQKKPLTCSAEGSKDEFLLLDKTSFDTQGFSSILSGQNESECRSACLQNCSCDAYQYDKNSENCSLITKVLWSSSIVSSGALNLRVSSEYGNFPTQNRRVGLRILAGVLSGCAFLLLIGLGVFVLRRNQLWATDSRRYIPGVFHRFSYKQLQSVTKDFKEKIGSGGFGAVYKGVLSDNTPVAVKKLQVSDKDEQQFRMEVNTIGTIQHAHLVRLVGFCSEGSNRLLVQEYVPYRSLDQFLFRMSQCATEFVLEWSTRYQIALETARAIAYLHEQCRECIIHCDIKPENILLGDNFRVKVSGFGLAKLLGREFGQVITSIRGTRGYLAPEWILGSAITPKADVYSFGMTLLEIISGRRNLDTRVGAEKCFFPVWAAMRISKGGELRCLADERLGGKVEEEAVRRAAYTAVWCIQDDEEMRPRMGKVVQMLEGTMEIPAPPVPMSITFLGR